MEHFNADEYNGNPQINACMFVYDGTRAKPYPLKGILDQNGNCIILNTAPIAGIAGGRKIASKTDIAVTNGATVEFLLNTDGDGAALPADMEIKTIIIQPHDGAATPAVVSNRWIFKMYTHSDRDVDDIFHITDRVADGRVASDSAYVLYGNLGYLNEEGNGEIPCSLYIETGDEDAIFTVKVIFS